MIWGVLIILAGLTLAFVCRPLLGTRQHEPYVDTSYKLYGDKINELDRLIAAGGDGIEELAAAKTALQRKALDQQGDHAKPSSMSAKAIVIPLATVFCASAALLYSQLGSPKFSVQQNAPIEKLEGLSLEQLVVRLERNLEADPANANGWIYYARSLMTLGRHDDALAAYDRALVVTNSDEKIVSERASAVRYLDQLNSNAKRGPTSEDVEAASAMTPAERKAMIQNMVDGLSDKLIENPLNEESWVRLLKARGVLGQSEQLATEMERMKSAFAGQPETIERILTAVGLPAEQ